ncbi:hypothetical protein LUU34_00913700 [Aix galericulata]|nr:hypothetical protein LUU34_00913700 [Aix galericulata]
MGTRALKLVETRQEAGEQRGAVALYSGKAVPGKEHGGCGSWGVVVVMEGPGGEGPCTRVLPPPHGAAECRGWGRWRGWGCGARAPGRGVTPREGWGGRLLATPAPCPANTLRSHLAHEDPTPGAMQARPPTATSTCPTPAHPVWPHLAPWGSRSASCQVPWWAEEPPGSRSSQPAPAAALQGIAQGPEHTVHVVFGRVVAHEADSQDLGGEGRVSPCRIHPGLCPASTGSHRAWGVRGAPRFFLFITLSHGKDV